MDLAAVPLDFIAFPLDSAVFPLDSTSRGPSLRRAARLLKSSGQSSGTGACASKVNWVGRIGGF